MTLHNLEQKNSALAKKRSKNLCSTKRKGEKYLIIHYLKFCCFFHTGTHWYLSGERKKKRKKERKNNFKHAYYALK